MLINGRLIASHIIGRLRSRIKKIKNPVSLGIVSVGDNKAFRSFILQKQKVADEVGIVGCVYKFKPTIKTQMLQREIKKRLYRHNAWIVQLPLPKQINTQEILDIIPVHKDADVLSTSAWVRFMDGGAMVPPSVGVLQELFSRYHIALKGRQVVVVGFGRLIGQPVALWLIHKGACVEVINVGTKNPSAILRNADIIISGVGKAGIIRARDVKKGVVLIDFGFSQNNGIMRGDISPLAAQKAKWYTPVPGGTGPILVAVLMKNVLLLTRRRK